MPTAQFFTPGFDEQVEQQNIERQRKYADMLRQNSMEPPQGQMVSGHYVAPSITQHLAKLLQGYYAGEGSRVADEKQIALGQALKQRQSEEFGRFTDMLSGKPAITLPEGQQGPVLPAQAPDVAGAFRYASQANTPVLQQIGVQGSMNQAMEQAKLAQAEAQRQKYVSILASDGMTPQKAQLAGVPDAFVKAYYESANYGRPKVSYHDNGSSLVPTTEYGDTPTNAKPIAKTGNPFSDLVLGDGAGGVKPNVPLVSAKEGIARAGKPTVSVDARQYSTQENEQSKAYGKSLGEIRGNINQAGWDAPKKLAQLSRMEQLLQGIDGGAAAPTIAQITSLANSFGIKLDPRLGAKQAAEALSREMAGSLRQPGTGPMTDKDFDNFLTQVPSLSKTAEGRAQITKTMRAAIERDQRAAKFARDYAQLNKGVIDDGFFDAVSKFYADNPITMPVMPDRNIQGAPLEMPKGFRVIKD